MYEQVKKPTSSWSPKVQKKPSKFGPQPYKVQPKQGESKEMPAYKPLPTDWITDNPIMRMLETASPQEDSEGENSTQLSTESETIQRLCSECEAELAEEEQKQPIQTKLTVGAPGDHYEQEADRVASQVMSMPDNLPQVQRFPQEENSVQMWSLAQSITPLVQRQVDESVQMRSQLQRSIQGEETEAFAQQALQMSEQNTTDRERISLKPLVQQNVTTPQIQRWGLPTDWLDYIGLGIDVVERAYIELAYEEGDEKDLRRFENTLFFAIDLVLAALPAAGGGGLAMRGSRQLAIAGWGAIPDSAKLQIAEQVAKQMGWSVTKALQMINVYMSASNNRGGGGTPGNNQAQNRQFRGAVQEIERRIGRKLSKDEIRQLHDTITGQNYGYHEIVEEGIGMFGN
ncbi:MAG TPA: hypothetical protein DDZ80_09055 [Cyanobacteria bacterium UBA8803]|nr:hypothetical protein [Cyanobacteria bacterium UBA8803]